MQLKKVSRKRAKLRIGIFGASGSGKTMSSLKIAHGLTNDWSKIAIIDTERGSAELYEDLGDYNTLTLDAPFSPERYIEAIDACEKAGMEVIIVDSISHEWIGKGGCLELVEKVDAKNDWGKWKFITPRHNAFIDRILQSKVHIICCGRSKDDVVLQSNNQGKMAPQKVGLKAVTREGFDYEMTLCFDIDAFHQASSTKDRTQLFDGVPPFVIDETHGQKLIDWLNKAPEEPEAEKEPEFDPAEYLRQQIRKKVQEKNIDKNQVRSLAGVNTLDEITDVNQLTELFNTLTAA